MSASVNLLALLVADALTATAMASTVAIGAATRRALGHAVPTAALCCVPDNRHPVGTVAPDAYFGGVRTIVLQSGNVHAGARQSPRRDLDADFRAAFGRAAPRVAGIALASGTDTTGAHVKAWFGDLTLTPDSPKSVAEEPHP